jgi:hypothetical protein
MSIIYFSAIFTTTHYKIAKKELIIKGGIMWDSIMNLTALKKVIKKKKKATIMGFIKISRKYVS